jgi:hypothetical protein
MSEEQNVETNDGTWSGLKKTIIATLTTVITGGGVWLSTALFSGQEEPQVQQPVQQVAPVININNTQQQQQSGGGKTIIIKEKAPEAPAKKSEEPVKPKKEFTEEEPKW